MEANKNDSLTLAERISQMLRKTQQEVEELALQFSLGKAEAKDKFEEIKKDFSRQINAWMKSAENLKSSNSPLTDKLRGKLDELELQLSLGKAEGKDFFEEQRKKINKALQELEAEIRNDPDYSKRLDEFNETLEKFKLKLEILRMKFENKSFKMKEGFDKEMLNARIEIDQFLEKAGEKWEKAGKKYANFSTEMNQVYDHLKKAVRSL